MEACYGGTDVMERSCAMAREIDINTVSKTQVCLWLQLTLAPGNLVGVSSGKPVLLVGLRGMKRKSTRGLALKRVKASCL